ncbi:uncharacterized protein LOC111348009 [Spodoptera litura]|uniref:Uncharacterized protein LOC111348009 n=1 Tax=Spodoptera litura TaxID=69820 RepID=A0A9J7DQZ3_SPOLT|nr:uncharacterized protein LOC111348009 [Spodoptera litura]XP_022814225.1 uncharacterized protein LOC111348009 [Spodoptera litura]
MMYSPVPLLLLVLTSTLAAPAMYDDYTEVVPQKRAALVLDRLLVALQKALHEDSGPQRGYQRIDPNGPRTAPLRIADDEMNDLSALQRRGSGNGRGRVLRCYFNAVTCF